MLAKDLTTGSVRKHMTNLAVPSIMASLFTTLYNVVDTLWAGKVGLDLSQVHSLPQLLQSSGDIRALTGMSMAFPIFLVMLAFSLGVMSGTLALIGNALGRKDSKQVRNYFTQALLYAVGVSLLLWAMLPFLPLFLQFMGARDPVVLAYALQYITTIIGGNFLFSIGFVLSASLISHGDTKTQRNISIINFFLNMVLDPLFLFGFGPIPAMGLQGIALATLVAKLLGLIVLALRLSRYQTFSGLTLRCFRPHWGTLQIIAKQSLPPSLNTAITSFLLGLVNRYANIYGGAEAVAAYGISLRIEQIALIPSMGVSTALASISSQSNGAGKVKRMESAYRVALGAGLLFFLLVMLPLGWIFPRQAVSFFTTNSATVAIAQSYLKICVLTFYSYMLVTFSGAIFQATQKPHLLSYITIGRNCVLPLLTFALFSKWGGLMGLWLAILVNNWLGGATAFILALVILRRRKREISLQ